MHMNKNKHKLTLDQPTTYQIKVPGSLDMLLINGDSSLRITVDESTDGQPISTLIGQMDQAALHGLLRRLYGLGVPLISAICVDFVEKRTNN